MAAAVTLICAGCGQPFTVPFWMKTKGRKLCSLDCKTRDPIKTLTSRSRKEINGCWTYLGFIGSNGYGQITHKNKGHLVHRLMWEAWNNATIPDGLVVRHTCVGNRACVNPDHLVIGTQKDNVQDCINQGRFVIQRGDERRTAKLTEADVRRIRSLRKPDDTRANCRYSWSELGRMFGVSGALIWHIVKRRQWTHVK